MTEAAQVSVYAIKRLKRFKKALNHQEFIFIKKQILAGEGREAMLVLDKILERKRRN